MFWCGLHTYALPYLHMHFTSWAAGQAVGYVAGMWHCMCALYNLLGIIPVWKIIIYRHGISKTPKKPQHNTVKIAVKIYFPTLNMTVKLVELTNLIRLSACAVWHCLIFCGITGPAIKLLKALVRTNQFTSIHMNGAMTGYTIEMWS